MKKIKIVLVGYGSQGTRIAEAVSVQPDIQLIGVGLKEPDISARMAFRKGFPIYVTNNEVVDRFEAAKVDVQGLLSDVLPQIDVAVDATPSGVGRKNKEVFYSKYGVKSVFQAGEPLEIADIQAFISTINYYEAREASSVRIPSPFTVSLTRTLKPLDTQFGIKHVNCTFVLPGSEPMRGQHGPVDSMIPTEPYVASRKLRDEMRQIFPKSIMYASIAVPSILLAIQVVVVDLEQKASTENVIDRLCSIRRSILVRGNMGLHSTDTIFEYIRRVVRPSADVYEVCTWHEHLKATDCRLKLVQAFDPHCVQTPEIIDSIRALTGKEEMEESYNRTNNSLRILSPGIYP